MKTICFTIGMALAVISQAQVAKSPSAQPPGTNTNSASQLPNSQNNASYNNNSMQNNKPVAPNTGPYTGNGDYVDPTRNTAPPPIIYNNTNQLPVPTPVNNATGTDNNNSVPNQR